MKKALLYTFLFLFIQLFVTVVVMSAFALGDMINGAAFRFAFQVSYHSLVISTFLSSLITLTWFLWRGYYRLSVLSLKSVPWGVLVLCVPLIISTTVPLLVLGEWLDLPDFVEDSFTLLLGHWCGAVLIALLGPVAEEVVFRGAILGSLLKSGYRSYVAVLISSLFFMLVHGNPAQMPGALIIGLLLGWLFVKSHSILPGIICHCTNNLFAVLLALAQDKPDESVRQFMNGSANIIIGFIVSVFLFAISFYLINKKLKCRNILPKE